MLREAGQKLRQLRDGTYGMTLADVERRSIDEFGEAGRLTESTLSLIERGALKHAPDIEKAAELGMLYNLTPTQLFRMYGLPCLDVSEAEPPQVSRLRLTLRELGDDQQGREELLQWIDFACSRALARKVG
jgi:transcriptional regulator with XRE-family HTH domain